MGARVITVTLCLCLLVSQVLSQCSPSPCGVNTNCEVNLGGAAVCRCRAGWDHAPGSNTIEGRSLLDSLSLESQSNHPGLQAVI